MKTKCYAIYCSKHPLYNQRAPLLKTEKVVTGFRGDIFLSPTHPHAAEVACLEVVGDFHSVDPEDFEWPETAYADGYAHTFAEEGSVELHGACGNEDYEGKRG